MIDINLSPRRNPNKPGEGVKYYPAVVSSGEINFKELSTQIAKMTSLSRTDCTAVITALLEFLPEELLKGHIVRLDDFGSFRLTVRGEGLDRPEDFKNSSIYNAQVRFNPGTEIKTRMKQAIYRSRT